MQPKLAKSLLALQILQGNLIDMNNIVLLQTQINDVMPLDSKSNSIGFGEQGKTNSVFNEILNDLLAENNIDGEVKNINQETVLKELTSNEIPFANRLDYEQHIELIIPKRSTIDNVIADQSDVNQSFAPKELTTSTNENAKINLTNTEKEILIDEYKKSEIQINETKENHINNANADKTSENPIEQVVKIQDERINYVDIQPAVVTNNVIKTSDKADDIEQVKIKSNPVIMDNQKMIDRADEPREKEVNIFIDKPNESQSENTETQTKDKPIEQIVNIQDERINYVDIQPTIVTNNVITTSDKTDDIEQVKIKSNPVIMDNQEMTDRADELKEQEVNILIDKPNESQSENTETQTKDKPIEQSVKIQDERINYVDIQPTIVTNNIITTSEKTDDTDQVKIKSNPVVMDNQKMTDRADELKEQEVNILIDKPNESQSENTETQTKDKPIEQIANTDNNKIFISYNKTNQNEQVITKNNDSKHKLFNYTEIATQNIDNDNFEIPLRLDLQQREDIKLSVDKPQSPTNTNLNTMSETFKELNISSINYYKPNNIKNERINDKTDNSIIYLNIQQLDTNSKQNVKPNITLGNIQTIKFFADQRQGKTAFVAETIPRIENKLENITTTSSDNRENGKANPEAFFKNIETPTQKIVNEPVFMVQKIENGTVQKDVDIKSKILELPEKVVEYIKTIKSYNDLKPHSVVIHLDPPNLGKIRLKVMMNNNNIRAEMNIANSITKEMIEAQLPEIRKGLMQHNIQLSEFNVMLDNNNPRHNQSLSQQEKWSTQTWLYDRNNGNKGNEEQKRRYMRFINNNSLVDLLT